MKSTTKKEKPTRRDFLKTAGKFGTAAVLAPTIVPSSVFGASAPSNRIAIGCIGTGGMGMGDMRAFMAQPAGQIVAVCDVDAKHRERARIEAKLDKNDAYNDFRELLERDDVDAVTVVTPDHWHVPISMAAAKAGKDVYCEKPLTLAIQEGRDLANVVRRYGRVLQTGSQQRSDYRFHQACELVRNGFIGELHTMRAQIPPNNRTSPPQWSPEPVPEGFDYDMWLGPATWEPYHSQRCHYSFRFVFDYSGGQMTNFGAHALDISQWANAADDTGPVEIEGYGEFPKSGLFNTALNAYIEYTYANGVKLICETGDHNNTFEGSEGWIFVSRSEIKAHPKSILKEIVGPNGVQLEVSNDHHRNFLDCVKLRKDPIANVEVGHRSSTVCHLGNIAMRLERKLRWDPKKEEFIGDVAANKMRARGRRSPWYI